MYGGLFKQKHGWYIEQSRLKMGIAKDWDYLGDTCPDEFASEIQRALELRSVAAVEREKLMQLVSGPDRTDIAPYEITFWKNVKCTEAEKYRTSERQSAHVFRKLENRFENQARSEFGLKKIGDAWLGETLLFNIVSRLVTVDKIIRHDRPEWLGGLELDIHIVNRKIALEYQGQQHFKAIKVWGGEDALQKLIARDKRKRELCIQKGVRLIEVLFSEPLTEQHILARLNGV
jgi:hypothetical protein